MVIEKLENERPQTREQHIKEKSNLKYLYGTGLLAGYEVSMYGVYHGPNGIRKNEKSNFLDL